MLASGLPAQIKNTVSPTPSGFRGQTYFWDKLILSITFLLFTVAKIHPITFHLMIVSHDISEKKKNLNLTNNFFCGQFRGRFDWCRFSGFSGFSPENTVIHAKNILHVFF